MFIVIAFDGEKRILPVLLQNFMNILHCVKSKESVNALPKVVGSLRVLRFPPTGNVDRVGWN